MLFISIVLPFLALLTFTWSAINFSRKDFAIAAGAAVMGLILSAAAVAHEARVDAWLEGGFGMGALAIAGAYAVGCAVAHRLSRSRGARDAALAASALVAVLGLVFFRDASVVPEEFLAGAAPEVRETILSAARGEAMRLVQFAAALLALVGLALVLPPRARSYAPVLEAERSLNR